MAGAPKTMLGFLAHAAEGMGFKNTGSFTRFGPGGVKSVQAGSLGMTKMFEAAATGSPFKGHNGGAYMGFMAGGIAANARSDDSQRGVGTFIKGGLWGAAGGALLSKGLGTGYLGKATGAQFLKQVNAQGVEGLGRATPGAVQFSHGAWKAARLVESAGARKYAFASGAMLAGGFMGGDRSRAHGFNANRGNRFSG